MSINDNEENAKISDHQKLQIQEKKEDCGSNIVKSCYKC